MSYETLSELCRICYSEKPKYRCPRCKTQTCSLACYKKHQQRSVCDGKRDPSEYVKKSQLATPVGIDRDYNYLKGLERTIDLASRETLDRGIGDNDVSRVFARGMHQGSKLQHYLTANRITVDRAPRGMTRQKINNTRTTKRGHVMWTVEWIDDDGNREVQDNCLESSSVNDVYSLLQLEKSNAEKRKLEATASASASSASGKKRKSASHPPLGSKATRLDEIAASHTSLESKAPPCESKAPPLETAAPPPESEAPPLESAAPPLETQAPPAPEPTSSLSTSPSHTPSANPETSDKSSLLPIPADPDHAHRPISSFQPLSNPTFHDRSTSPQQRHFYLCKPNTPSVSTVLLPLEPSHSMTSSLQNQTVLEFPTIYVLSRAANELPERFMLAKEYARISSAESDAQAREAVQRRQQQQQQQQQQQATNVISSAEPLDRNRVLDLLRRDVTR